MKKPQHKSWEPKEQVKPTTAGGQIEGALFLRENWLCLISVCFLAVVVKKTCCPQTVQEVNVKSFSDNILLLISFCTVFGSTYCHLSNFLGPLIEGEQLVKSD